MKMANQKNKIHFTSTISKYFSIPSIEWLVNSALLTFQQLSFTNIETKKKFMKSNKTQKTLI
ncbi:hypothetical protein DDZ16_00615 [Marinilabilia rubra]|uniref:Uncharacterized protein n=1 Tax=Marinilabilia rubra TaxID=2162893 RepID=A0A2U2BDB1_9BACT|nr:hypothetical protein DDZ16_00615 [Marinilabilia rubra]